MICIHMMLKKNHSLTYFKVTLIPGEKKLQMLKALFEIHEFRISCDFTLVSITRPAFF